MADQALRDIQSAASSIGSLAGIFSGQRDRLVDEELKRNKLTESNLRINQLQEPNDY